MAVVHTFNIRIQLFGSVFLGIFIFEILDYQLIREKKLQTGSALSPELHQSFLFVGCSTLVRCFLDRNPYRNCQDLWLCLILIKLHKRIMLEKKNVAYFRRQLCPHKPKQYVGAFFCHFAMDPSPCWEQNFSSWREHCIKDKYVLQSSPACSCFHTLWLILLLLSGAIHELLFNPRLCSKCTVMRGADGQSPIVPCHWFHRLRGWPFLGPKQNMNQQKEISDLTLK